MSDGLGVPPQWCRFAAILVKSRCRLFTWQDSLKKTTSHTRLRARDYCTSSTLIGGKGGAGPSSLHTTLEGPTEYVNAIWMIKSTWIPTWHPMDHVFMVAWTIFKNHLFGGRPNTKLGDHGTPNTHNRWFILFSHVWGPAWIKFIEIAFGWGPT